MTNERMAFTDSTERVTGPLVKMGGDIMDAYLRTDESMEMHQGGVDSWA